MSDDIHGLHPHYCPICGKEFYPIREWAYKKVHDRDHVTYYCSWSCYRKRPIHKKHATVRKRRQIEQLTLEGELIQTFKNVVKAADNVLGDEQRIYDACRLGEKYKGFYWRYKVEDKDGSV